MSTTIFPVGLGGICPPTAHAALFCQGFIAGRIHRMLLAGPPGSGKSFTAEEALRLRDPLISGGDIFLINANGNAGTAAEVKQAFSGLEVWTMSGAQNRALIINEVDTLITSMGSALKTMLDDLDRVRPGVPIIMTTNDASRMQPALLSRMSLVDWPAPSHAQVQQIAERYAARQGKVVDPKAISKVIAIYGGDIRQIKTWVDVQS